MDQNDIEELRARAIEARGAMTETEGCAQVWSRLVRRELEVVEYFATSEREYLVLRERSDRPMPLSGRRLDILQNVLVGVRRKVVSFDFCISASAIAQTLSMALREIGLHCSPARIPPLLVVLARAARGDRVRAAVTLADLEHRGRRYCVATREADSALLRVLAPAQRAVLKQVIYGSTYAEIAALRRTSYRTVANQVASGCRRLGVSGRFDLVQFVVSDCGTADA
jgi:DNA-binding NarL/FixJ family response regulator